MSASDFPNDLAPNLEPDCKPRNATEATNCSGNGDCVADTMFHQGLCPKCKPALATFQPDDAVVLAGVIKALYPLKMWDANEWEGDHPIVGTYAEVEITVMRDQYKGDERSRKLVYVNVKDLLKGDKS